MRLSKIIVSMALMLMGFTGYAQEISIQYSRISSFPSVVSNGEFTINSLPGIGFNSVITSIDNERPSADLVLFPNPTVAGGEVYLRLTDQLRQSELKVNINDVNGSRIGNFTITPNSLNIIDIQSESGKLTPGIYLIKIIQKQKHIRSFRLIVQ